MWEDMTPAERTKNQSKAYKAIRKASEEGSKLERYLFAGLLKDGYRVNFHVEQKLSNQKLQIDMVIPTLKLAIEVDGPSHFEPIWGEKNL